MADAFATIAPQLDAGGAHKVVAPLVGTIRATKSNDPYSSLQRALATLTAQLSPEDALSFAGSIMQTLRSLALADPDLIKSVAGVLAPLTPRLRYEDARTLGGIVIEAMKATSDPESLNIFGKLFTAVAKQLRAEDTRTLGGSIVDAIKDTTELRSLGGLRGAFGAIASSSKSEDARLLAHQIIRAIPSTNDESLSTLGTMFEELIPRLGHEDYGTVASSLSELIKSATNLERLSALSNALIAIIPHLSQDEVRVVSSYVLEIMQERTNIRITRILPILARKLQWRDAAQLLVTALKYPTVYGASQRNLIKALAEYPEGKAIKLPDDIWGFVDWIGSQPGIAAEMFPVRTLSVIR